MKVELVFRQVYLQGECVQHSPSHHITIRLKRKRIEGQTGHAERAAFSSELAGLSFVYLGQDTPRSSKNKDQGWTVVIHSCVLKGHELCASACSLTCCNFRRDQSQSSRSPVRFACKNSLLKKDFSFQRCGLFSFGAFGFYDC